ncbi:MAG TPA: hypothetical protein VM509_01910, partial [Planctomycetota bacterium]|nr:hypothetical protein [Planctomycetota bacterium]
METRDVLGEVALELNPRALAAERDGTRLRVAFRAGANASELRSFLGEDLRIQRSATGVFVADFDRPTASTVPASPRARALLAAATARALPARAPRLLAVLNVTPDSFSDGGLW